MGTLADSLFSVLMSWVRALVSGIWALFSSERTTVLEFLGKNWIILAAAIIAAGLVIDWLVWLIRWQPYHIWARRARRLLHIEEPEEDESLPQRAYAPPPRAYMPEEPEEYAEEPQWLPLEQPVIGEEEAQQVFEAAQSVPDESLGQYPGMRYDSKAAAAQEGTRRYAAVHAEGPGAAEVSRRRAEIDAWQKQMQEEARQKAEAERAARRAAYEAEQARLAQEAYEAEQARLAQEEYERQMEEYERQKAQYERDLAQYEREKAEYEAALAAQEAAARQQEMEAAQEMEPASAPRRSLRRRRATYSDYVEGETVSELPAPPAWTRPEAQRPAAQAEEARQKPEKHSMLRSGMAKMAQMIEPENEEVTGIASLPPRVDVHAAYRPAKKPPKGN